MHITNKFLHNPAFCREGGRAMNQKDRFMEKTKHGTVMFPVEYYDCRYPLGLPSLPVHWHEEFEITYIRKGRGIYLINLKPCRVEAGDILFFPSGILHGIPEEGIACMESDSFVFHPDLLGSGDDLCRLKYIEPLRRGETRFSPVIRAGMQGADEMMRLLQALRRSFTEKRDGYELEAKAMLLEIIALLYRYLPCQTGDPEENEALEKIRAVVQYIKRHYPEQISISDLADACHLSQYYFMRFFKQHMNMTCVEYLNQYRLEIAAGRLISGGGSIMDVALDTGFRSISYFNRVFKRKFGMTPGEYRNLSRKGAPANQNASVLAGFGTDDREEEGQTE